MKKTLFIVVALSIVSASSFGVITNIKINVLEAQGSVVEYNHAPTDGGGNPLPAKLEFLQGSSAVLYDDMGGSYTYDVILNVNMTGMSDSSGGGWASGTFSAIDDWTIDFLVGGTRVGGFEGNGGGNVYTEVEGTLNDFGFRIDTEQMFGSAIFSVTSADLAFIGGGSGEWADGTSGGLAKFKSHSILQAPFGSFADDDYLTSLSTVWLYADETTIPEPATMAILGLGALLLRRRKA